MTRVTFLSAVAIGLVACGLATEQAPVDAGVEPDSGRSSKVAGDAGLPDAGEVASEPDAGAPDGSTVAPLPSPDGGKLADKPFMGWSSWSSTTGNIDEAKVKAAADAVAAKLLPFGYSYINIDDGWYNGFDTYGRWKPDLAKFPNGISGAASYVHGKGLKFGLYLTPGLNDTVYNANSPIEGTSYHAKEIALNAAGNTDKKAGATAKKLDFSKPGAKEYVEGYARLLASWGVDFIKMDFVGPGGGGGNADNQEDIKQWRAALDKTGRPIWLELSNQLSISAIATWKGYSNGWRIGNDVECYCSTLTNWTHVVRNIDAAAPWARYAGPGGWNDLDSLEIGNGSKNGLSADERTTYFTFWAINASPLYLGADVTNLDPADLKTLTNQEVIDVDQAGLAASPVSTATRQQVWSVKNPDGSFTVGLFNFDASAANVTVTFSAIHAGNLLGVRDLFSHSDLGKKSGSFSAQLPAHCSRLLKLTP